MDEPFARNHAHKVLLLGKKQIKSHPRPPMTELQEMTPPRYISYRAAEPCPNANALPGYFRIKLLDPSVQIHDVSYRIAFVSTSTSNLRSTSPCTQRQAMPQKSKSIIVCRLSDNPNSCGGKVFQGQLTPMYLHTVWMGRRSPIPSGVRQCLSSDVCRRLPPSPPPLLAFLVPVVVSVVNVVNVGYICFLPQPPDDRAKSVHAPRIAMTRQRGGTEWDEPVKEAIAHNLFEVVERAYVEWIGTRCSVKNRKRPWFADC